MMHECGAILIPKGDNPSFGTARAVEGQMNSLTLTCFRDPCPNSMQDITFIRIILYSFELIKS